MTIAKVAKLAKVSMAMVSRTINRVPTVDPVLARRVWRVIEQVDYYPNTHARTLVSGRSHIFGLVISDISNPFFPEIVRTFTQLGIKHNYEVLLSSAEQHSRELETAARRMIERRVDGVAILTFGADDPLIRIFAERNVPVVAIDRDFTEPLIKTFRINYEHGIRQAVQHLAALRHVRIAFIAGPLHVKTAATQKAAFERCMSEIGLCPHSELLVEGDNTMESGMTAMSALAALPDRPSAVICSNDMTAIGVIRQAFELSLHVPRNLSVVGFDDISLSQFIIPPLTTVRMSQAEIAEAAFSALLEYMEPCKRSPRAVTIRTHLVLRRSTALARGGMQESITPEPGDLQTALESANTRAESQSVSS